MRIAVCIPVYRPPAWYEIGCLASVEHAVELARAAGHEVEIRIGADGCREALDRTLRWGLDCLFSETNVGVGVMRNSLLAHGDYDAWAYWDADDWMHAEHLIHHAEHLPDGGMTTSHRTIAEPGRPDRMVRGGSIGRGLISHEAMARVGGFAAARACEDTDLWRRLQACGVPIATSEKPTWRYVRGPESLTRVVPRATRDGVRAALASHAGVYLEPVSVPLVRHDAGERRVFEFRDGWPYGDTEEAEEMRKDRLDDMTHGRLLREAARLGVDATGMERTELLRVVRAARGEERARLQTGSTHTPWREVHQSAYARWAEDAAAAKRAKRSEGSPAESVPAPAEPGEAPTPAEDNDPRTPDAGTDYASMTVADLRVALTERGITPPARTRRDALIALLQEAT